MERQAKIGRAVVILLFVWACSVLLAGTLAIRVDAGDATLSQLEMSGGLKNMSDRQIAEETTKAERIFKVMSIAKGVFAPLLNLGLGCLALLVLIWFFRGRVDKRAVAPVAAATLLPGGFADLIDAAAAFQHSAIPAEGVPLAPRDLNAVLTLVGHPLAEPWTKLGGVLDFYSFWAAVLMAYGVAAAGQVPRKRALIGTFVAWVCFRLLTKVAIGG